MILEVVVTCEDSYLKVLPVACARDVEAIINDLPMSSVGVRLPLSLTSSNSPTPEEAFLRWRIVVAKKRYDEVGRSGGKNIQKQAFRKTLIDTLVLEFAALGYDLTLNDDQVQRGLE